MKRLCGLIVVAAFAAMGCNRPAETPAAPPAPAAKPYGNLAQVMQAIPFTHSNIVFDAQTADPGKKAEPGDPNAQGATAQFSGVYGGWIAVENAGVALQETANLITIPGRMCSNGQPVPLDQEDFKKWAADLATVGAEVQKVGQGKTWNEDQMLELGGKVSDACFACHEKYRDTPNQPKDRCMPGGSAPAAAK
jgi:hypothetical protein